MLNPMRPSRKFNKPSTLAEEDGKKADAKDIDDFTLERKNKLRYIVKE